MNKHKPSYVIKRSPKKSGEYLFIHKKKGTTVISKKKDGWKYIGSCYYPTLRDAILSLIL